MTGSMETTCWNRSFLRVQKIERVESTNSGDVPVGKLTRSTGRNVHFDRHRPPPDKIRFSRNMGGRTRNPKEENVRTVVPIPPLQVAEMALGPGSIQYRLSCAGPGTTHVGKQSPGFDRCSMQCVLPSYMANRKPQTRHQGWL